MKTDNIGPEDAADLLRRVESIDRGKETARLASEKWQATFDALTDIVCVLSINHEFLEINEAGVRALGLPKSEIIGRKCYELVHGRQSPIPVCPCREMFAGKKRAESEYEEHGRWYNLIAWPIIDARGDVGSFVHV
ncbi:MAG: PAS domain-containing protein, partial [Syntrophales bacterium]